MVSRFEIKEEIELKNIITQNDSSNERPKDDEPNCSSFVAYNNNTEGSSASNKIQKCCHRERYKSDSTLCSSTENFVDSGEPVASSSACISKFKIDNDHAQQLNVVDRIISIYDGTFHQVSAGTDPTAFSDNSEFKTSSTSQLLKGEKLNSKTSSLKLYHPYIVMLSYVTNESSVYAAKLKEALQEIYLSTYLDSNNLLPGCDWQTDLTNAIKNCFSFVPIISRSYGETLWTAREFKLADCLSKYIIPINFSLDRWPPESLAIQLSATQYVDYFPKKLPDSCFLNYSTSKFHRVPILDYLEDRHQSQRIKFSQSLINEMANQIKLSILERFNFTDDYLKHNLANLKSPLNSPQINVEKFSLTNEYAADSKRKNFSSSTRYRLKRALPILQ